MTLIAGALFVVIGLLLVAFLVLDTFNRINPSRRGLIAILLALFVLGMVEWYLYDYLFG